MHRLRRHFQTQIFLPLIQQSIRAPALFATTVFKVPVWYLHTTPAKLITRQWASGHQFHTIARVNHV